MRRFTVMGLTAVMLVTGTAQLAFAKSEKTELFAFDEIINVFDKEQGSEIEKTNIPSGSKIGDEGNLSTWGTNASNAEALSASVVSGGQGANGEAFQIHYTNKLSADSGEFLRIDSVSVNYADITEETPLVLEFRLKAEWEETASMNACVDVVPVIKPETGYILENNPFIQQSVQPATDNGLWQNVKYVVKQVTTDGDKASFVFDRYVNNEKKLTDQKADMASGSGAEGAALIGFKIRPRARQTSYNENGYLNLTFDSIRLYSEKTVIPTGTRWGDDLTIDEEYNHAPISSGTVIGDNNTVTAYKLANADGSTEGYSAQIAEDNSSLIIKNVSSSDGYKSTLTPGEAKKYTSEDISENGALVYEAKYKIEYNLAENGTSSYSAVQMYFDFYRADNKTMQFAVPAVKKESGEYVTVKVIIPKNTFEKNAQPYLFIDNTAAAMNVTLDDLEYIALRRVVFANKARAGQTVGEEQSAATLTLDYLDQYMLEEAGGLAITPDDLADEIEADTVGVNFTGTHFIDKSTVTKAVLKKKADDGSYAALDSKTYGVKSTGDNTFYMGFGGSLVPGAEYEIDLSAVKDIYGNSTDTKVYFSTAGGSIDIPDGEIKWLDCTVSDNTISYKLENSTDSTAEGDVYAAVMDEQSGVLQSCGVQHVTVSAQSVFENTAAVDAIGSGKTVYLFFWDSENTPYVVKNTISVE